MLGRKGTLKPIDAQEQEIRDNATYYNVVLFVPTTSSRSSERFDTLDQAKEYSVNVLTVDNRVRSCMIYASNQYDNHAMVGSMCRGLRWKEVVPARY